MFRIRKAPELKPGTYDQFVNHSLEQTFGIGRHDIVEFLTNDPPATHSLVITEDAWAADWGRVARRLFTGAEKRNLALRFKSLLSPATKFSCPEQEQAVRAWLERGGAEVWEFGSGLYLYRLPDPNDGYCVVGRPHDWRLHESDVVKHIVEHRKLEAFQDSWLDLVRRLNEEVERIKYKSGRSYQQACAVSVKGDQITVADKVCLVDRNEAVFYWAKDFEIEKLVKPDSKCIRMVRWTPDVTDMALGVVATGIYNAVLLEKHPDSEQDFRTFIVNRRFCPVPPSTRNIGQCSMAGITSHKN